MFRVSQFMNELIEPTPTGPRRNLPGPVVIWNLIRRCNLKCKHCYAVSADHDFPGELSTEQINATMDDLKDYRVPVLILSGGEPLLHPDIFDISRRAKDKGFYVGLSTNGTLIDEQMIGRIAETDYNYVGISLDGVGETHDKFRGETGAFDASLKGVRLCVENGIKVGLRFTITQDNASELPALLRLAEEEGVGKFYLSHLNYAGRGNKNRGDDAHHLMTRDAMDYLFDMAWRYARDHMDREIVTGNNDADGVYLYYWVKDNFPEHAPHIRSKLVEWGGNASGINIANIDNLGNVHPDTMWAHYTLGNVKKRPFSEIWEDTSDPVMAGLKALPRAISGRCGGCRYFDICGGNTRVRAHQLTGDPWAEDPGCYLDDDEIGVVGSGSRVEISPYGKGSYATIA